MAPAAARAERSFAALGTEVRLIVEGPAAAALVARAEAEVLAYHARLSRFLPGSKLCALNRDSRDEVPASPLLRDAVRAAIWAARRSGGLVDPCLLDELERAGYDRSLSAGDGRPALVAALPRAPGRPARPRRPARWRALRVDDARGLVARPPGLRLDLGGSGKGHLADRVARLLAGAARWVVDCGGDVRVGGAHEVHVAHPLGGAPAARLHVADVAVATSSVVARAWARGDGTRAHHLLDPSTGAPAWTGVLAATALAPTTLHAETLAKVALLGGPVGARRALARRGGVIVHAGGAVELVGPLPALEEVA